MAGHTPKRAPVRVLVVDDSELARVVLTKLLTADPDIEVVGTAANGGEAIGMVEHVRPDIVTMDLRMPGIGGLQAAAEIMRRRPTPVIIVTSSSFGKSKHDVFRSFKYGVLDLLEKPPLSGAADSQAARILVEKVKLLSRVTVAPLEYAGPLSDAPPAQLDKPARARASAIGIGASTGGPAAVQEVLRGLPANLQVPVLLVQHMSPDFIEGYVSWLAADVPLEVRIARNGELPAAGTVLVAPGDAHMSVSKQGRVRFDTHPAPAGIIPSADVLFSSLAQLYGAGAVGVVLTGIGRDGTEGARDIVRAGGTIVAQDEATSAVFGMPKAVIGEDLVDEVLPIAAIANELLELIGAAEADRGEGG